LGCSPLGRFEDATPVAAPLQVGIPAVFPGTEGAWPATRVPGPTPAWQGPSRAICDDRCRRSSWAADGQFLTAKSLPLPRSPAFQQIRQWCFAQRRARRRHGKQLGLAPAGGAHRPGLARFSLGHRLCHPTRARCGPVAPPPALRRSKRTTGSMAPRSPPFRRALGDGAERFGSVALDPESPGGCCWLDPGRAPPTLPWPCPQASRPLDCPRSYLPLPRRGAESRSAFRAAVSKRRPWRPTSAVFPQQPVGQLK